MSSLHYLYGPDSSHMEAKDGLYPAVTGGLSIEYITEQEAVGHGVTGLTNSAYRTSNVWYPLPIITQEARRSDTEGCIILQEPLPFPVITSLPFCCTAVIMGDFGQDAHSSGSRAHPDIELLRRGVREGIAAATYRGIGAILAMLTSSQTIGKQVLLEEGFEVLSEYTKSKHSETDLILLHYRVEQYRVPKEEVI